MRHALYGIGLLLAFTASPALAADVCGVGPSGILICNVLDEKGRIVRTYNPDHETVKRMALGTIETKQLTPEEDAQFLKLLLESLQSEAEDSKRRAASLADENAKLSKENARLSAELERVKPQPGLCSNTTKLLQGMTKKQVAKLFGEATYSRMSTCGGAPGVARWQCESLRYPCLEPVLNRHDEVILIFAGNHLNSWQ